MVAAASVPCCSGSCTAHVKLQPVPGAGCCSPQHTRHMLCKLLVAGLYHHQQRRQHHHQQRVMVELTCLGAGTGPNIAAAAGVVLCGYPQNQFKWACGWHHCYWRSPERQLQDGIAAGQAAACGSAHWGRHMRLATISKGCAAADSMHLAKCAVPGASVKLA